MGINGETSHNWAEAPKYYLMARLYWNPDVDVDALLAEWYELAVGTEAAGYLAGYFSLWDGDGYGDQELGKTGLEVADLLEEELSSG